jgi:hypothetical protein
MKHTTKKPSPKEVQAVFDKFEWLGLVRKTGVSRKGQPVYELTEFGVKLGEDNPGQPFEAAINALVQRKLAVPRDS